MNVVPQKVKSETEREAATSLLLNKPAPQLRPTHHSANSTNATNPSNKPSALSAHVDSVGATPRPVQPISIGSARISSKSVLGIPSSAPPPAPTSATRATVTTGISAPTPVNRVSSQDLSASNSRSLFATDYDLKVDFDNMLDRLMVPKSSEILPRAPLRSHENQIVSEARQLLSDWAHKVDTTAAMAYAWHDDDDVISRNDSNPKPIHRFDSTASSQLNNPNFGLILSSAYCTFRLDLIYFTIVLIPVSFRREWSRRFSRNSRDGPR
jgi:hypothetical protein